MHAVNHVCTSDADLDLLGRAPRFDSALFVLSWQRTESGDGSDIQTFSTPPLEMNTPTTRNCQQVTYFANFAVGTCETGHRAAASTSPPLLAFLLSSWLLCDWTPKCPDFYICAIFPCIADASRAEDSLIVGRIRKPGTNSASTTAPPQWDDASIYHRC